MFNGNLRHFPETFWLQKHKLLSYGNANGVGRSASKLVKGTRFQTYKTSRINELSGMEMSQKSQSKI